MRDILIVCVCVCVCVCLDFKQKACIVIIFSSVRLSRSVVSDSLQPHGLKYTRPPCPSPTPRVYSNSCLWIGDAIHLILCCPLLLPPSIFPSIRVFSNESVLHIRYPKYWSFSSSISPSKEYPYMTTGKTIALTRQTFVGKVISLLFNNLIILNDLKNVF